MPELAAMDTLLAVIPFLGLYLITKHFRGRGAIGKLYIAFAWVYAIGFSASLYFVLK